MIGAMRRGQGQGQGQEAGEAGDRRRELEAGGGSWRREAGAGGRGHSFGVVFGETQERV